MGKIQMKDEMEKMREALRPLALLATEYDNKPASYAVNIGNGVYVSVEELRKAYEIYYGEKRK